MEYDIIRIVVIILVTWGLWALNGALNPIPKVKEVLSIVVIVVGCLFLITPVVDVISLALNSVHGR